MSEILNVGDAFFAYIVVRDEAGDQAASGDITLSLLYPDSTTTTDSPSTATSDDLDNINADNARNPDWTNLTVTTGVYVSTVELTQAGSWWLRWAATDPVELAKQQAFYVYPQRVP